MNVKHCGGEPSLVSMSRLQAPRGHTASVTSLDMASEKSCNVSCSVTPLAGMGTNVLPRCA